MKFDEVFTDTNIFCYSSNDTADDIARELIISIHNCSKLFRFCGTFKHFENLTRERVAHLIPFC